MNPLNFLTDALGKAESWEIADFVIAISIGLAGAVAIWRLDQEDDGFEDESLEATDLDDEDDETEWEDYDVEEVLAEDDADDF